MLFFHPAIFSHLADFVKRFGNLVYGVFTELPEITNTYTDTWGKLVKFVEIKKYTCNTDYIYTITPDFDTIQYIEPSELIDKDDGEYVSSEEHHLEGVDQVVKDIYAKIKQIAFDIDNTLVINPQKYYISIKAPKNIAFIKLRNKKVRFIAMMPEDRIREITKYYKVASLSKGVQDFYNGPCAAVDITNLSHENELTTLISTLISYHHEDKNISIE